MFNNISTKDLIKELLISLFDGNDTAPDTQAMLSEVKRRLDSTSIKTA